MSSSVTDGFVYFSFIYLFILLSKQGKEIVFSPGKSQLHGLISTFVLDVVGINLLKEQHPLKPWVVLASNSPPKILTFCVFGVLVFLPVGETCEDAHSVIDCSVTEALRH